MLTGAKYLYAGFCSLLRSLPCGNQGKQNDIPYFWTFARSLLIIFSGKIAFVFLPLIALQ